MAKATGTTLEQQQIVPLRLQFAVSLTPAGAATEKNYLAQGFLPVYAGPARGKKRQELAKIEIGGQAFNLLLSKTTTWEP